MGLDKLANAQGELVLSARQDIEVPKALKDAQLRARDQPVEAFANFRRSFGILRSVQKKRRTTHRGCGVAQILTHHSAENRTKWARGAVIGASDPTPKALELWSLL